MSGADQGQSSIRGGAAELTAQKQADAVMASQANIILLNKQAEAEPLRQQVAAFGNGDAFAQFFFYRRSPRR